MNSKRLYYLLVGALCLAMIALVGVAYGANVLLSGQSKKLATAKANSLDLSNQATQLTKNKNDVIKYSQLNKIAETIVPQDKDQAEAVREIVNIAAQSGIPQISSITFPASTLGVTGGANAKGAITQVTPVKGISGVYDQQITITQGSENHVSYNQFIDFLSRLEQNRRTAQVSAITISPDTTHAGQITFTLVMDEFIKP